MSDQEHPNDPPKPLTGKHTYNVVTDTVGGPNVRLRDNLFQAIAVAVCVLLGAGIGVLVAHDGVFGAMVGAFGGLVIGILASGFLLMIFRAIQHIRGKHD